MIIIADSSSTRTEWAIVDATGIVEQVVTDGINPYFQTRREISHIIRLQLPQSFFKHRFKKVYFYGSGCASPERIKIVELSLTAQFRTAVEVYSDLMGAARGMLGSNPGIACILSTGSNSCMYDGNEIVKNVRPGGFILGDEGSGAYLGKMLVADIIKGLAPNWLVDAFYEHFNTSVNQIHDDVYTLSNPNLLLSRYSTILADYLTESYCYDMVYSAFMTFFKRNISTYEYAKYDMSVLGNTGCLFADVLVDAARDFGANIYKIEKSVLQGLTDYHMAEVRKY